MIILNKYFIFLKNYILQTLWLTNKKFTGFWTIYFITWKRPERDETLYEDLFLTLIKKNCPKTCEFFIYYYNGYEPTKIMIDNNFQIWLPPSP